MRNFLFIFLAFSIVSCAGEESEGLNQDGSKLRKVVHHFSANESQSVHFFYNGEKLVKEQTQSGSSVYHFEGDLITKISSGNYAVFIDYDSQGRLLHTDTNEGATGYENFFEYEDDGSVQVTSTNAGEPYEYQHIFVENGEVIQRDLNRFDSNTGQWKSTTYTYVYDSMNQPEKGPGRWIFNYFSTFNGSVYPTEHNLYSITQVYQGQTATWGYEYTYNEAGYPMQAIQMNNDWQPSGTSTDFYYE